MKNILNLVKKKSDCDHEWDANGLSLIECAKCGKKIQDKKKNAEIRNKNVWIITNNMQHESKIK